MNHLIIDTETTGLSPRFNKTLTVGLLLADFQPTHLKILDSNHIFIKHKNYNSSSEALKVNKIDLKQHTLKAVHPTSACNQINSFLIKNQAQQTPLVGHCIHFDKSFLSALFEKADCNPLFHHTSIDTLSLWKTLQRKNKVPPHLNAKLGTIASHFNINYERAHDALADCHITAKVYHKMLLLQ